MAAKFLFAKALTKPEDLELVRQYQARLHEFQALMMKEQMALEKFKSEAIDALANRHGAPRNLHMGIDHRYMEETGIAMLFSMETDEQPVLPEPQPLPTLQ